MTEPTRLQMEVMAIRQAFEEQHARDTAAGVGDGGGGSATTAAEGAANLPIYKSPENMWRAAMQTTISHTIERCAQELEAAHAECSTLSLLQGAARLRALKDKP
jgi:hypothetical protein